MILKGDILRRRWIFSFRKTSKVLGVTSRLNCGECIGDIRVEGFCKQTCHILMWDFDNQKLSDIETNLRIIQVRYALSDIRILESNKEKGNYHAYCFTRTKWNRAIEIACATRGIDWDFVRLAVYRGNFTLRVSQKLGNPKPELVSILDGFELADCTPEDLEDFIEYEIWVKA